MAKTKIGIVVSDKMDKTRVVEVERLMRHPLYQKVLKRQKRFYAHDESGSSKSGDRVVIAETRPMSKTKRWKVVKVFNR